MPAPTPAGTPQKLADFVPLTASSPSGCSASSARSSSSTSAPTAPSSTPAVAQTLHRRVAVVDAIHAQSSRDRCRRPGGVLLAARFVSQADGAPAAAARRRRDLPLRRDADSGVLRRVERRGPRRPRVHPEVGHRPGPAGVQRHLRAGNGEPGRHQHPDRPVAADGRGAGRSPGRRGAAPLSEGGPRRRVVRDKIEFPPTAWRSSPPD